MKGYPIVTIKAGRDTHLRNRHHAVYSTAVQGKLDVVGGSIVEVQSSTGEFLCFAMANPQAYISLRAISFEQSDPLETLRRLMKRAIDMRTALISSSETTALRLINAEGDAIPGLVVDRYGDVLVVQLTTLGMDRMRAWIAKTLQELTGLTMIFEKSLGTARRKEGLEPTEGWIGAKGPDVVPVVERGLKYDIQLKGSQKTGLFLDQREMRALVRQYAAGRTVLDVCSYVGGFSVSALAGGAVSADAVDYDADALARVKKNAELNGCNAEQIQTFAEDAFDFLRRKPMPRPYDFIILDPPAFAKRSSDLDQAKHAYTDLNRMAMQALPPSSLLLTCSCSYQVDANLFQTVVFHAARQAGRDVRIIQRHRQALDHPVNIYHPETDYLKSLLLWVE